MAQEPFALSLKVVIRDQAGRCLMLKRSAGSRGNPGRWDFPGGKLDPGEAFDAGLLREVAEETGLTISLRRVLGAAESESPTRKIAYLVMEGQLEAGQVRLSEEHEEFAWVSPQDMPAMDVADQFRAFAQSFARTEGARR